MKRILCIRTSDGIIHDNEALAKRHAEERYGNALKNFALDICALDSKYVNVLNFLDSANTQQVMAQILALSEDRKIEPEEDSNGTNC